LKARQTYDIDQRILYSTKLADHALKCINIPETKIWNMHLSVKMNLSFIIAKLEQTNELIFQKSEQNMKL